MLELLHLKGVGPSPELRLELGQRLNVLTGDNGLGKTFLLDIAWWALTRTWPGLPAWPDPKRRSKGAAQIEYRLSGKREPVQVKSSYQPEKQEWSLPRGRPARPGLVFYARVDGSFSIWDPARNLGSSHRTSGNGVPELPEAYHFSPQTLWDGLKSGERVLCQGLVQDWGVWQLERTRAFEQLENVLRGLSPSEEEILRPGEPVRVSLSDVRKIPTLEMPYGTVPIVHASAAIKRILGMAYGLVWAKQEHLETSQILNQTPADRIVVLIDEVESHLHPRWQRLILPALLTVVQSLSPKASVQILVTTHAPMVLASLEPVFDQSRDELIQFDLEEGEVRVSKTEWYERGDASAWLTSEIFDLGEARSLPAEKAIQRATEAMRRERVPLGEMEQIHADLRSVLKDTDPFWPRWLLQARQAGMKL